MPGTGAFIFHRGLFLLFLISQEYIHIYIYMYIGYNPSMSSFVAETIEVDHAAAYHAAALVAPLKLCDPDIANLVSNTLPFKLAKKEEVQRRFVKQG